MGHSMLYISDEDKNEKGATADSVQQRRQYRRQNRQSSSGYKRFYPRSVLSHTQILSLLNKVSVHVILHSSSHGLLRLCPNPNLGVFSSPHTVKATLKTVVDVPCALVSDTGSSSSEDEGPKRPTAGPGARNGEVRRRRSRTPSPRRRHRDMSPR